MRYAGSVKNLYVEVEPTPKSYGIGYFEFTDDFSVFDYGKMPQKIPFKGEALKRESVFFFNLLEGSGIKTHFIEDAGERRMRIKVSRKLGYADIDRNAENYMVPIEVIFRNKILPSSSLHRRLRTGEANPRDYGLLRVPGKDEAVELEKPVVEFSTKIEDVDRYITRDEALRISGLSSDELDTIVEITEKVNRIMKREVEGGGLELVDGKLEFICGVGRELLVADTVGTSDENRFLYKGIDLSKQMLRDYYIRCGWYDELMNCRRRGLPDPEPPPLDEEYLKLVSESYRAVCAAITKQKWDDVKDLNTIVKQYRELLSRSR